VKRTLWVVIVTMLAGCRGGSAFVPASDPAAATSRVLQPALSTRFEPPGVKRVYQPDWAGPVLFTPGLVPMKIPQHRFASVEGEWTIPEALPTINCSNPKESIDGSSLWIAIDGWAATYIAHQKVHGQWTTYRSSDILQAGTESDVHCYHGGPLSRYATKAFFWIEWGGYRDIAVEPHHHRDLTMTPGDTIDVRIDVATTGSDAWQEATLNLKDETTGFVLPPRTFHSGCVDCGTPYSRPAKLFGNTAEWITEATFYNYGQENLPNTLNDFGKVRMSNVVVRDQNGLAYSPGRPNGANPNIDWMTWNGKPLDNNGTLLACSTTVGSNAVTFTRAPYVIATPGQQGELEPKPQHC
jgi:hypothetical protein